MPNGSTVKLYDGDKEIGTGTTSGTTATVTVSEALSGKPITAETVVTNNNGKVTLIKVTLLLQQKHQITNHLH